MMSLYENTQITELKYFPLYELCFIFCMSCVKHFLVVRMGKHSDAAAACGDLAACLLPCWLAEGLAWLAGLLRTWLRRLCCDNACGGPAGCLLRPCCDDLAAYLHGGSLAWCAWLLRTWLRRPVGMPAACDDLAATTLLPACCLASWPDGLLGVRGCCEPGCDDLAAPTWLGGWLATARQI